MSLIGVQFREASKDAREGHGITVTTSDGVTHYLNNDLVQLIDPTASAFPGRAFDGPSVSQLP